MLNKISYRRLAIATVAALLAGCSSHAGLVPASGISGGSAPLARAVPEDNTSLLKVLKKQVVIGSTIDPKFGQLNPYGLTVAPVTSGDFVAGDLVVCNFNDKKNVQGTGFTIVSLHPAVGSKPALVAGYSALKGCASLAMGSDDTIWAGAFSANDDPIISSTGKLLGADKGKPFDHPWGQAYAQPKSSNAVYYESNAGNGTIVRINLGSGGNQVIAKGFAVNHGKPGSIFAPAGLTYDPSVDTLYIADGTNNTVVAFDSVSTIGTNGVVVEKGGKTFGGPDGKDARLVTSGGPLSGPISLALLPNHNLIAGNTGNPSGQNIMVEMTPSGKILATRNVDKGASGSLFGIVATGSSDSNTIIYFNDDNDNNLQALEH